MNRTFGLVAAAALLACSRSSAPRSEAPPPQPGPTSSAFAGTAANVAPATTEAPPVPSPASTPGDVSAATGAPPPATPATPEPKGPLPLPVTSVVATATTATVPLSSKDPAVVDPASRFSVETSVPLVDARLALVDADDAMIPAAESHEIGAKATRFTLVPDAPLRPGTKYTLRLDGASAREAHDSDGRAYQVAAWPIRVAGDPPPPQRTAPPRGKRRR